MLKQICGSKLSLAQNLVADRSTEQVEKWGLETLFIDISCESQSIFSPCLFPSSVKQQHHQQQLH